jgi:hypothetical protein
MIVEHRHHLRVPTDIETLIYRSGLPVATGLIRNVSRCGVLLRPSVWSPSHQPLQLEFRLSGDGTVTRYRWRPMC